MLVAQPEKREAAENIAGARKMSVLPFHLVGQTSMMTSPPTAQSKRPPQTARSEKADDSEEFDPPARPEAPEKCRVQ